MVRVLLIDDDSKVRAVFRGMLESAGYEVAEAGGGEEGVRAYRRGPASVVLCDMFMPGRDGLEVIRDLHLEFPGVKGLPVARRLGAAEVLYKPFSLAAALAAIKRALGPAAAAMPLTVSIAPGGHFDRPTPTAG